MKTKNNILGKIDLVVKAIDSAYSHTFIRSVVCLPVVCLSHSCPLLKPNLNAIWQLHLTV